MTPKIATCCYCGTRAALVLDRARHELSCSSCGAPLREMKSLPIENRAAPAQPASRPVVPSKPRKKPKKRKSFKQRMLSEMWDAIEDIFD
ncbi:hypothetical protein ACSSV8_001954 [Roseovarius sp. MBR-79]|jgi:hypothetical protein